MMCINAYITELKTQRSRPVNALPRRECKNASESEHSRIHTCTEQNSQLQNSVRHARQIDEQFRVNKAKITVVLIEAGRSGRIECFA